MSVTITAEELFERLSYDAKSGVFVYLSNNPKRKRGEVAGCLKRGYVVINIKGGSFAAHRLAWLYAYGELPDGEIDHIDGNKSNNALANLRVCNHQTNMQNRRSAHSNNSTGFLGVQKVGVRFRASVVVSGRRNHVGMFSTAEDAHLAYVEAKRNLHEGCTI